MRYAACAPILAEARFLPEWLVHHRLAGIERFYLFDTSLSAPDPATLRVLAPWIESGVVVLHRFDREQGCSHQTAVFQSCFARYAREVEAMMVFDVDEFFVDTGDLNESMEAEGFLARFMESGPIKEAQAVAFSRVTWWNQGVQKLADGKSVMKRQTVRETERGWKGTTGEYTKVCQGLLFSLLEPLTRLTLLQNIVRTSYGESPLLTPYSHNLAIPSRQHPSSPLSPSFKRPSIPPKVIDAQGSPLPSGNIPGDEWLWWYGGVHERRVIEPAALYHYIERDVVDCEDKVVESTKVCKDNWRSDAKTNVSDLAAVFLPFELTPRLQWCTSEEPFRPTFVPHTGVTRDRTLADSSHVAKVVQGMQGVRERVDLLHEDELQRLGEEKIVVVKWPDVHTWEKAESRKGVEEAREGSAEDDEELTKN